MDIKKTPKNAEMFVCECCDFECRKKSDWIRHINRPKHLKEQKNINETPKNAGHICGKCAREYKYYSGLWKHNKTCIEENKFENIVIKEKEQHEIKILTNLVLEVVKNNSELQKQTHEMQKQMLELYKQGAIGVHNSHNTNNSHNKTFNLNFFLNEQCKDAMNIMDFVNTFQLDFSDFERIGEVGYVEGISNIVIDKLNEMDVYKRPIHCSDAKREIMYVKDKDVWEKENENNDKIRLALKHITKKNTDLIRPWAIAHPGVLNSDHRLSDKYQEMIIEAMGGNKKNKNMKEGEDKIIKKISKMVLIDKNM
jgi:hypothetical protein